MSSIINMKCIYEELYLSQKQIFIKNNQCVQMITKHAMQGLSPPCTKATQGQRSRSSDEDAINQVKPQVAPVKWLLKQISLLTSADESAFV